jgi:UDP-glucose 4-epimerase
MTLPRTVLLTGATGYIASHTWLALQAAGYEVVGVDDFRNSSPRVLERLAELAGRAPVFERADVCDAAAMAGIFARHRVDAVVHFAALKAVGESTAMPLDYYGNNLGGLVTTCKAMRAAGCRRMVFSSSATVYGAPERLPITEDAPLSATNPYGWTKLVGEQILRDLGAADPQWQTACLRYFNPVGAHESGRIGEDPRGAPNNLMPYVAQVAVGRRPELNVFGDDYDTPDGTGVRDYIHVTDLAEGHVAALRRLLDEPGSFTVNLGTGRGHSVLEVVRAYEAASGRKVAYRVAPRRPGDVARCYADPGAARALLGWQASLGLDRMCVDSWRWQSMNPAGFEAA